MLSTQVTTTQDYIPVPSLSFPRHSVLLKFHDSEWQGSISCLTDEGLLIAVDGFIPTTISQGVKLTIFSGHFSLEIRGNVSSITVDQKQNKQIDHPLGHMMMQITWTKLDEFTFFKLKNLLAKQELQNGFLQIALTFVDNRTGDELIHYSSAPSTPFDKPASLPELAKSTQPKVISNLIRCSNGTGQMIVGYHDHQEGIQSEAPVILLAPGYGETKREHITLAYYLASNGFHVLRYDHTHHVGESDGDHEYTSLTKMKQDIQTMLDFVYHHWNHNQVALVATSLAGRVALKALSESHQVDLLILINGIVDVRATLAAVHQEDLIGDYLDGNGRGVTNVLGFNVDGRIFLKDTVEAGFSDLTTTIQDAQNLASPIVWFSAEQDAWVETESFQQVVNSVPSSHSRLYTIPEGLHRLQENPRKARAVYRQIVFACQDQLSWQPANEELIEPSRKDIGQQNRIERERNQTLRFRREADHVDFWSNYLSNFHYIAHSHDYMAALDHIYHLLGTVAPGDRLLDAGCGNGHFGSFLFAKEWTRRQHHHTPLNQPIQYVGVDFVDTALTQAQAHLNQVLSQAKHGHTRSTNPTGILTPHFYRLDLNKPLPFKDESFDRIMSNLVIGYLQNPIASIRELLRVLAPGGKLVVTNLKPCSDLTQIYRNFVDHTTAETAIREAREVLNNSSHIRQGESDGVFQFYTQEEFCQVLKSCGAENPQVFPTFGNQAYIGVIEKTTLEKTDDHTLHWNVDSLIAA